MSTTRILDGICARAEKGEIVLTSDEFEALQEIVVMHERGWVPREQYDAMMRARDHCKRQATDAGERLAEANAKLRARLKQGGQRDA